MTENTNEGSPKETIYAVGEWIDLFEDFDNVSEEVNGRDKSTRTKTFYFKVDGLGKFEFELGNSLITGSNLSIETQLATILSPLGNKEIELNQAGHQQALMESDLFSFMAYWNDGRLPRDSLSPFSIELKSPDDIIFKNEFEGQGQIDDPLADDPVAFDTWEKIQTGKKTTPLVPRVTNDYIKQFKVRITQPNSNT